MRNIFYLLVVSLGVRVHMFERIRQESELEEAESMDLDWQMQLLIGVGWKSKEEEIRKIVLEYIKKAYKIRNKHIR